MVPHPPHPPHVPKKYLWDLWVKLDAGEAKLEKVASMYYTLERYPEHNQVEEAMKEAMKEAMVEATVEATEEATKTQLGVTTSVKFCVHFYHCRLLARGS